MYVYGAVVGIYNVHLLMVRYICMYTCDTLLLLPTYNALYYEGAENKAEKAE